jgi:hypothetical protein
MKKHSIVFLILSLLAATTSFAAQSTITEAVGSACMGDDKSRKQTEEMALTDAKKKAVEYVSTYMRSETNVKNFVLEKDLVSAYTNAAVKIIQELEKSWYKDPSLGDCYRIRIKAEVVPDENAMGALAKNAVAGDDPSAPLSVKAWTDKKAYKQGDKIKVYIKGNKPFYARVLYRDANGEMIQLLPNAHRSENYFNGGTLYEVPTGNDQFELEVSPPFGEENVIIYASTSPLGDITTATRGALIQVQTSAKDLGMKTRGIKIAPKSDAKSGISSPATAAEFFEDKVKVTTGK